MRTFCTHADKAVLTMTTYSMAKRIKDKLQIECEMRCVRNSCVRDWLYKMGFITYVGCYAFTLRPGPHTSNAEVKDQIHQHGLYNVNGLDFILTIRTSHSHAHAEVRETESER